MSAADDEVYQHLEWAQEQLERAERLETLYTGDPQVIRRIVQAKGEVEDALEYISCV
jgi:hypothetical protein